MLRKNVASQYLYFALVNATNGAALTGATVTGKRAIDGAAQASVTGTISEEALGQYKIALSQADVNGNNIGYLFTATNAVPVNISVVTTAADPTDSVRFGLTSLPNAAASAVGGLPVAVDTSGRVDVLKINGTSQTARDIGASVLVGDKTGFALSSAAVQAIWDALTSALTTAGSAGKLLVDNLNATVSSRLASASYTAPDNTSITAIKAKTDNLPASPAATGDAMALTSGERTTLAAAIWAALTSGLTTAGSIGKLLVDNINASISSRLASASYTAPDNASVAAIKAKTDNLPASPAAVGSAMALTAAYDAAKTASQAGDNMGVTNAGADAVLDRAAGVETGWTLRQSLRIMLGVLAGKAAGAATTTMTFRDMADTTNRVTATVDADGNRTAVTLDPS